MNGLSRNSRSPDDPVPEDLLSSNDADVMCKWLCLFVMETRQKSGCPYPPSSLYSILCGLYRVCRSNGVKFNFLDKADSRFQKLHKILDSICSKFHADGVGAKQSAAAISIDDEHLMWESGTFSFESPQALQNMVFFYIGLHLCLRGVQEQHDLKVKQLQRCPKDIQVYNEEEYYEYTELISKNNQHRFKDIHMKNKKVKVHAIVGSQKCMVKMIDFYLSKLPEDPKAFYLRPRKNCPDDGTAWYINVPVGVNTLKSMLPNMSKNAGTSTRYTNHSLRATSKTRIFQSGVQEKIIQEKTGHRSLTGLRCYARTTAEQEQNVTRILGSVDSNVDLGQVTSDDKDNLEEKEISESKCNIAEKENRTKELCFQDS